MNAQEYVAMGIKTSKDAKVKTVYTFEVNVQEIHDALNVDKPMQALATVKGIKVDWQDVFRKKGPEALEAELERLNIPFTREDDVAITQGDNEAVKAFKALTPEQQAKILESV